MSDVHPSSSEQHTDESSLLVDEVARAGVDPDGVARGRNEKPPSLLAYPATYVLVGINLLMFGLMFRFSPAVEMIRHHAGLAILTAPFDVDTLVRFGAMDKELVLAGQWWRLISAAFVHVTILHLLLNMWCLWNLGLFGEPLLGKRGLVAVYVLTGWAGMMLSLAWGVITRQDALVAGASGAVFGIAGILIVLLSNKKLSLPWNELRALRRSVVYFAVINLGIGILPNLLPDSSGAQLQRLHIDPALLPRVSMSAHLGGFFCGLAVGLPLFPRMTTGRQSYRARQRLVFGVAALVLCLIGYALGEFAK